MTQKPKQNGAPPTKIDPQPQTRTLSAADGTTLHTAIWQPTGTIRGVLTLCHGQSEHSGRYKHVGKALSRAGYALVMPDLRGHGKSEGKRGHITSFDDYLSDLRAALAYARQLAPEAPQFFGGHSMGGCVALYHALSNPEGIAGVVVSSAWVRLTTPPPASRVLLARLMNAIAPGFAQDTGLDPAHLSHDEAVVRAYRRDPLVHGKITAGAGVSILDAQDEILRQASSIQLPIYFFHGSDDMIASPAATRKVYDAASASDKTYRLYDGLYHETLNEPAWPKVIADLIAWLDAHTDPTGEEPTGQIGADENTKPQPKPKGDPMYDAERTAALEAAKIAGKLCLNVRNALLDTPEAMEKVGREPVTIADFGAQAVILKVLSEHFPEDAVIAEEKASDFENLGSAEQRAQVVRFVSETLGEEITEADISRWLEVGRGGTSSRVWTVDPIDGTKGFIRGDQFANAIALLVDGVVTVSALGCPAMPFEVGGEPTGAIATAVRGEGGTLVPLEGDGSRPLKVSPTQEAAQSRVVESVESGHTDHDFSAQVIKDAGIGGDPVRMDSQAKYLAVSDGRAEIYIRNSRGGHVEKIWDHAAGVLVVLEAGGMVTDLDGKPLNFALGARLEENRGVLATNGPVHKPLLTSIKKHS